MLSLQAWLLFIPSAFALAVYPGPNNLLALSSAAKRGFLTPVLAGFARIAAFAIMIALCGIGLGSLLAASEIYFTILKWIGGLYLIYIGVRMLRARTENPNEAADHPDLPFAQLARQEFLVAITNPKAMVIFTAFFPQFLIATEPVLLQFTYLGIAFLILEMLAIAGYAFVGAYLSRFTQSERGQKWLNRGSGTALISAGLLLTASQR